MMEKIRIDKYLWCIRLFKTRSLAVQAIDAGKVKYRGESVKPSKAVQVDDEYELKLEAGKMIIRVTALLDHRVGYPQAILHYLDLTPEEDQLVQKTEASSFYTGKRLSKVGRPTKQQRRRLDDFMEGE